MVGQFYNPVKINMISFINLEDQVLNKLVNRNVVFITTKNMIERYKLQEIIEHLKQNNNTLQIMYSVPNPTDEDLRNAIVRIQKSKIDTIIALGGGSAIDLGKGIKAFSYLSNIKELCRDQIRKVIQEKEYLKYENSIELIAIPTTAGTGSEVTQWATIWDYYKKSKMSIDAYWLLPNCAVIIPELTMGLSQRMTLATGLDALCHATESYWAVSSNSIVRELAKIAIRMIMKHLPLALENPYDIEYRKKLCLGSLYAGLAFSQTRTTACHAISYPLTMQFNVEHGFAASITLGEIMKINSSEIIDLPELLLAFSCENVDEVKDKIETIAEHIQKLKLHEFGISKEQIPNIVEQSFMVGRMDNNPVCLTTEDVNKLLLRCL